MAERTPFDQLIGILDSMLPGDWDEMNSDEVNRTAFLAKHGWNREEFEHQMLEEFNGG